MSCELGRVGCSSEGCCWAADENENFDGVEISLTDSKKASHESPVAVLGAELAGNRCAIGLPIKTARRMRCLIPRTDESRSRVVESSSRRVESKSRCLLLSTSIGNANVTRKLRFSSYSSARLYYQP